MTSDEIFDALEWIGNHSSKLDKIALLKARKDDDEFVEVLIRSYNPYVTYGVAAKTFPETSFTGKKMFNQSTFLLLSRLASRIYTGHTAIAAITDELTLLTPKSGALLKNIILRDLRCGIGAEIINAAIKPETAPNGIIPTFDCALAVPFNKWMPVWPRYAEPKIDGVRCLAFVHLGTNSVLYFSRNGKPFTTMEHCSNELLNIAKRMPPPETMTFIFDGEAVADSFLDSISSVKRKTAGAVRAKFCLFDWMPLSAWENGGSEAAYAFRRDTLKVAVTAAKCEYCNVLEGRDVASKEEADAFYSEVRALGLEGLILKDPKARYLRKRHNAWVKMKAEESEDLEVTGFFEGEGKYAGSLGGLIVNFNGVSVSVGSGFSDAEREAFYKNPPIGKVIEVLYHEVTEYGSLRHPRFKRIRFDKS